VTNGKSTPDFFLADVEEQIATITTTKEAVQSQYELDDIHKLELGLPPARSVRADSKTWSSWNPDPLVVKLADGSESCYQIDGIVLTLSRAPITSDPYYQLWFTLFFKKTSLGWYPIADSELTLDLKNSAGGILDSHSYFRLPSGLVEMTVACSSNARATSYTRRDLTPDYFDLATKSSLRIAPGRVRRC
jgi:hypothetical protein